MIPVDHSSFILDIKFSPDGKLMATASADHSIKIWHYPDKKQLLNIITNDFSTSQVNFSADGKYLISCTGSKKAIIWSVANGALVRQFTYKDESILSANFSRDGKFIVTGTRKSLIIWDANSGERIHVIRHFNEDVNICSFAPGDNKIIAVTEHFIVLFDRFSFKLIKQISFKDSLDAMTTRIKLINNQLLARVTGHFCKIYNIDSGTLSKEISFSHAQRDIVSVLGFDISLDQNKLICFLQDRKDNFFIKLYSVTTGELMDSARAGPSIYWETLTFTPDSKFYFVADSKLKLKIFSAATLSLADSMAGNAITILNVKFSPNGKFFMSIGENNILSLIETSTGKLLHSFPPFEGHKAYVQAYENYWVRVNDIKFSADSRFLYITWDFMNMDTYDCADYALVSHQEFQEQAESFFKPSSHAVYSFTTEGIRIHVTGGETKEIILRNRPRYIDVRFIDDSVNYVGLVTNHPGDKSISVYNTDTGTLINKLSLESDDAERTAKFSPDGRKIIMWQYKADRVKIIDVATGKVKVVATGFTSIPLFNLSLDNHTFYIQSDSNECIAVDVPTGKPVAKYRDFNNVRSFGFDSSGKYLLACTYDFQIKLWEKNQSAFLYSFIPTSEKDYLVIDGQGRYDGTAIARKLLYYVCGSEVITLDQLRELTWEPGLVAKLTGADTRPIMAQKLSEINICGVTPLVERVTVPDSNYHFSIRPRTGGVGQVLLWVNGQNIQSYKIDNIPFQHGYYELTVKRSEIEKRLYSDKPNTIDLRAYAADVKLMSKGDPLVIDSNKPKNVETRHHMYCIAVGITTYKGIKLNTLHFASQDASDIARTVSRAADKLLSNGQNEQTVTSYLLNSLPHTVKDTAVLEPYRDNIRKIFYQVAAKATADDIIVIFLSGHGVLHSDHQFYYLAADASAFEIDGVENKVAISTDTLKKWLIDINANKKILILDACNSGQTVESLAIKKGLSDDQQRSLDNLNERTGTFILAASASGHSAFEMSQYGQGILAYNLLLGIKTGAGLRENKFVDVNTWFKFASDKVELMAKDNGERQNPQSWGTGSGGGIDIGIADDHIKNEIVLSDKKPIVGRSIVLNTTTTADDLLVAETIETELAALTYEGKSSKLVYIENAQGVGVYKINCQYQQKGNVVTGKLVLAKNNEVIITKELKSNLTNLSADVKKLVDVIAEALDN